MGIGEEMKITPEESPDFTELIKSFSIKGVDINTIIIEYLKKLNFAKSTSKNKMQPRTNVFSVSQSSYSCYRKIYFEMVYPKQANDESLGRFAMGDIIDNIMKNALSDIGAKIDHSCSCSKDYFDGKFKIRGESDADFDDLVVEVKSVSPFAWVYIVGGNNRFGNTIIGTPKIQHVRQLNTYLDIKGIKDGVLIYVSKDNFQLKIYPVTHDRLMMSQTVGRCVTVYNAILEKRIPDKIKSKECLYCNYRDLC